MSLTEPWPKLEPDRVAPKLRPTQDSYDAWGEALVLDLMNAATQERRVRIDVASTRIVGHLDAISKQAVRIDTGSTKVWVMRERIKFIVLDNECRLDDDSELSSKS